MTDDPIAQLVAKAKIRKRGLPPHEERRRIRENAGVSQRELADALGVPQPYVWRWENENNPRSIEHLELYRRALDSLAKIP